MTFKWFLGAALALVTSFSAQAASENTDSTLGKGLVCASVYALCTSAKCIPDPLAPEERAICSCEVTSGVNFGFSTCEKRLPITGKYDAKRVISTYSFAQAPVKPVMACPTGKPWTDCLDQPCIVDPADPLKAACSCKIKRTGAFVTYGGGCNTLTCDTAYWSAASIAAFAQGSTMLIAETLAGNSSGNQGSTMAAPIDVATFPDLSPVRFCPGTKEILTGIK